MEQTINTRNHWVSIKYFSDPIKVREDTQTIHCDTRDFHIISSTEKPQITKKPECNYEILRNEGLQKLYNLISKTNRENYTIRPEEIIPWLKELCEATGGYDMDWRCLEAEVENCDGWTLKYIRFVRNDKQKDEFIVCNSYLTPIKWKEVIPNLRKDTI